MNTPTINKQSAVSIGLALALIGGAFFLGLQLAGIKYQMQQLETNFGYELRTINAKMDFLDAKVDKATDDRWTAKDAQTFAGLLQALNPKLNVPEASRQQFRGIDATGNPIGGSE